MAAKLLKLSITTFTTNVLSETYIVDVFRKAMILDQIFKVQIGTVCGKE